MARILTALALILSAGIAHAFDDGLYLGAAVHQTSLQTTRLGLDFDIDLITAGFIIGYRFNRYLAIEGNFRVGIDDDSVGPVVFQGPFGPEAVTFQAGLDNYFSGAVLGRLPIGHWFELFGKAGYGRAAFDVRGVFADFTEKDVLFGAGAQAEIGTVKVRAGYERLLNSGNAKFDGWELAVIYEM